VSLRGDMKRLMQSATKRGWQIAQSRRGSHYLMEWINGSKVTASLTPGDYRALKNCAADIKRVEKQSVDTNASKPYSAVKSKGDKQ